MVRPVVYCLGLLLVGALAQATENAVESRLASVLGRVLEPSPDWRRISRQIESLDRQQPGDPRAAYVLGLIALRQGQPGEAIEAFQRAKTIQRLHYYPAWQALIRTQLSSKSTETLFPLLGQFADALQDDQARWVQRDDPQEAFQWLGRVVGYMELPEVGMVGDEQHRRWLDPLELRLDEVQAEAYHAGRGAVWDRYEALTERWKQRRDATAQRRREVVEQERQEVSAKQGDLERKQQEIGLTAKELKLRYDREMAETGQQLQRIQQEYQAVESAAVRTLGLINETAGVLDRHRVLLERGSPGSSEFQTRRRIAVNGDLLVHYQNQLASLETQAVRLKDQASAVVARRTAAASSYQAATGQLVASDHVVQRWQDQLSKSDLKLNEKLNKPPAGRSTVSTLRHYLPFDWETEVRRIANNQPELR